MNYLCNEIFLLNVLIETFSFTRCPSLLILLTKFVFADLQYDCFVLIPVYLLFFFVFVSFSRLGAKNFKSEYKVHSVRPSVVFVFEKNVGVTSRRLETGSTSIGSTLQEEV